MWHSCKASARRFSLSWSRLLFLARHAGASPKSDPAVLHRGTGKRIKSKNKRNLCGRKSDISEVAGLFAKDGLRRVEQGSARTLQQGKMSSIADP
jgi:hypothetical protein